MFIFMPNSSVLNAFHTPKSVILLTTLGFVKLHCGCILNRNITNGVVASRDKNLKYGKTKYDLRGSLWQT